MPISMLAANDASAVSYDRAIAHVGYLQATYMPNVVSFTLDAGSTTCPAGTWFAYGSASTLETNKAVYATLLAAVNTGNSVEIGWLTGDATCAVQFIYAIGP